MLVIGLIIIEKMENFNK